MLKIKHLVVTSSRVSLMSQSYDGISKNNQYLSLHEKNARFLTTTFQCQKIQESLANILVARKAEFFFFFWPRLPRKSGLGTNMAEKAGLLWPRLPRKLGRGQACQVLPGRIFPVSLAKNPESLAWPGFAKLAGFLTALLMQG